MQKHSLQFFKNLERFRLITFDITDTLLRFKMPIGDQYAKIASHFDEEVSPDALRPCFKKEFKRMSVEYPNFGSNKIHWRDWWIKLIENTFKCCDYNGDPKKLKEIAEMLLKVYRTKETWTHIDGCHEIMDGVRASGKCSGCISNFDPSLRTVLQQMDIDHYFHFIITSYEAEVQKPQKEIFDMALEKLEQKITPSEALHIGNTYELDYLGAQKAGWSSILITNSDTIPQGINREHAFKNLRQLLDAFETKDLTKVL